MDQLKLIGKKLGMTLIFDDKGQAVPCSVIQFEPNYVVQVKTDEVDQYTAIQLGAVVKKEKRVKKPQKKHFENVINRVDDICSKAHQLGIKIFIDAEESWIQAPIDELVTGMMEKYNKERVTVYNTFQLYRHDRYDFLTKSYEKACEQGYLLGAKLVRGAYMEKERERAREKGYRSPIQPDRESTDRDFKRAIKFCVDHFEEIGSCTATHNMESCLYQAELIGNRKLPRNHPHLNFSQLYGMSDNITFNLAANRYNVSKYVPYGPVHNIIPYLIRRAEENSSVGGEFSREYQLLRLELNRRNDPLFRSIQ